MVIYVREQDREEDNVLHVVLMVIVVVGIRYTEFVQG